ncbi:hypothetical protein EIP86_000023 [Pleurotus ostreatoroseus]|nr:hypothetical protein EIP86_000023 [Pleurotus ostreatoroseus]
MGTSSCKIIRHRGYFFLWASNSNGLAEDLGAEMLDEVPRDPKALKSWARKLRKEMDKILRAYVEEHGKPKNGDKYIMFDGKPVGVSDCYESYDPFGYTYEFNLDQMLFHHQYHPIFHLANLPRARVLITAYDKAVKCYDECPESEGGSRYDIHYGAFHRMIPVKYRLDISRLPVPKIKVKQFKTYTRHFAGIVNPADVLSLPKGLSRVEQVSLRLLGTYVSIYSTFRAYMIFEEFALVPGYEYIGWNGQEIACALAAVALLPLHTLDTFNRSKVPNLVQANDECWFIRKHICFSLATHLHDDRNACFHISRVVEHILSTPDTPNIVFGVVFSVFHCIVFRVDTTAGGSFTRTDVLDFLAPPHDRAHSKRPPKGWLTPGMEILTRLGHIPAEDDIEFFYSNLSSKWWVCSNSHTSRKDVERDEASKGANNFALASKQFMTIAIPRLRLPQIRGDNFNEEPVPFRRQSEDSPPHFGHGHILESFNDKAFPITFGTRIDEIPFHLAVTTPWRAPYIFPDSDTVQKCPGATFEWCDTSGDFQTSNRFHRGYGPIFRWGVRSQWKEEDSDYRRRYNTKPHLLYAYVTDADRDYVLQRLAREEANAEATVAETNQSSDEPPRGTGDEYS